MMSEDELAGLEKIAPHAAKYVKKYKLDHLPNRRRWPKEFVGQPTDVFFKYLLDNDIKYEVREEYKPGRYN